MATSPAEHGTDNVVEKLGRIALRADVTQYLAANNGNIIPYPRYTRRWYNAFNHFQGVQRHGNYLLISAGHRLGVDASSQLVLVEMGSRTRTAWSKPHYFDATSGFGHRRPHPDDRVLAVADIDRAKWHAGGCQMMGTTLAVPVYGDTGGSEVRFYEVAGLFTELEGGLHRQQDIRECMEQAPFSTIDLPDAKVQAVALSRLPDRTPLAVLWDDKDLHFYHEERPGQWASKGRVDATDITGFDHFDPWRGRVRRDYQNLNLYLDTAPGSKPMFYLIGFHNTSLLNVGRNRADVFQFAADLDPDGDIRDADPATDSQGFRRVLRLRGEQYNFNAAVGTYLCDSGDLYVYCTRHWLRDSGRRLDFYEYAPSTCGGTARVEEQPPGSPAMQQRITTRHVTEEEVPWDLSNAHCRQCCSCSRRWTRPGRWAAAISRAASPTPTTADSPTPTSWSRAPP